MKRKTQSLPAIDTAIPLESIQLPCFIYLAADGAKTLTFRVDSLAKASAAWIAYRDLYELGNSDRAEHCGNIYGADGKTVVAHVSYNGRVWDAEGKNLLEDAPCLAHFSAQPCALCALES